MQVISLFGSACFQGSATQGVRRYGVPSGGFFDRESAYVANTLIGRDADAPLIELALARFEFECLESLAFSISGSVSEVEIGARRVTVGGRYIAMAGDRVVVAPPRIGARTYLAARFSGLAKVGPLLEVGARLECELDSHWPHELKLASDRDFQSPTIRVMRGPQAGSFDLQTLLDGPLSVSSKSDRVGIRLNEQLFAHTMELTSEPAGFGAVQVTPDGTAIILGPDGPTIGGYPKIAYVIDADLDKLAQFRPGQAVSFTEVTYEMAREASALRSRSLKRRLAQLDLMRQSP